LKLPSKKTFVNMPIIWKELELEGRILMKEKTKKNIDTAFIGEAKAYFRLLAFAEKKPHITTV